MQLSHAALISFLLPLNARLAVLIIKKFLKCLIHFFFSFREIPDRDGNPRTNFDNFWNAALAVFQVRICLFRIPVCINELHVLRGQSLETLVTL